MEQNRAQISMEFIVIIGALFFFVALFFLAIQENLSEENNEKERLITKEIALIVQDEINFAIESIDGYERTFQIPEKIRNSDYEINITSGVVYVRTTDGEHALALPVANVTGDVSIPDNTVEKINGVIYLNQ